MTPTVEGKLYHFEYAGLYDGVSFLRDYETRSFWNHVTGEAMYGALVGAKLPTSNLLQMTTAQALEIYPDLEIALSDRPIAGRVSRFSPWAERIPVLGERFRNTMSPEDSRRPTMDVGVGVWSDETAKYYPFEHLMAAGNVIMDEIDGRRVAVYFERETSSPLALYVDAVEGLWDGDALRFDNGTVLRGGVLYNASGSRLEMERPMQLFTRWYGYALMFPGTEIYEPR